MSRTQLAKYLLAVAFGASMGFLCWSSARTPAVLVFLPVVCLYLDRPGQVFALMLTYMMAATRVLLAGAFSFGGGEGEIVLNLLGWTALSAVVAAIWSLPHLLSSSAAIRSAGNALVQATLLVPPLWLFGVGHPIAAWGFLAPGTGWIGLCVGITVPQLAGIGLQRAFRASPDVGLLATCALALCVLPLAHREAPPLDQAMNVHAVNTRWGSPADPENPPVDRLPSVAQRIARLSQDGASKAELLVFPETTLGVASDATEFLVRLELGEALRRASAWVLLPMDRDEGGMRTSAVLLGGPTQRWLDARQPLPFALWKPWSTNSYSANWGRDNSIKLPSGRTAWVSFCYEDVMPGFTIDAVLTSHPDILVSVANNWFMHGDEGVAMQATSIEAMARLFAVPLVRAVNKPKLEIQR